MNQYLVICFQGLFMLFLIQESILEKQYLVFNNY